MANELVIINSILSEHEAIKHQLRMLSNKVHEQEALFLQEGSERDPAKLQTVAERQFNLSQIFASLSDGLRRHEAYENSALPALIGELLMEGIRIEHAEIREHLRQLDSALTNSKKTGSVREEMLAYSYEIRRASDSVRRVLEAHISKEEGILDFLQKAVQDRDLHEERPRTQSTGDS